MKYDPEVPSHPYYGRTSEATRGQLWIDDTGDFYTRLGDISYRVVS